MMNSLVLEYTTFGDRINNFFTGTISLDSQKVGINIDADENGPTNGQREFCRELFDRYPKLKKDVIIPFLKKELDDWLNGSKIVEFDKEFTIDGLSISRIYESHPCSWSLTLYCLKISHYVTIEFIGFKPQDGVIVDG